MHVYVACIISSSFKGLFICYLFDTLALARCPILMIYLLTERGDEVAEVLGMWHDVELSGREGPERRPVAANPGHLRRGHAGTA